MERPSFLMEREGPRILTRVEVQLSRSPCKPNTVSTVRLVNLARSPLRKKKGMAARVSGVAGDRAGGLSAAVWISSRQLANDP
jgi:hypothetical protein